MPYRRLPKTDAARLRSLKTILDDNSLYTAENRFIEWKTLSDARIVYNKLCTAVEQVKTSVSARRRTISNGMKYQRNATMYVSHFLQVLMMSVERGEIKRPNLDLYGIERDATTLPNFRNATGTIEWGDKIIAGEKARLLKGGRPIYNPTIGMLTTHLDIFKEHYARQLKSQERVNVAAEHLKEVRKQTDDVILSLWNQIEKHFSDYPESTRLDECRRYGMIYYYRTSEKPETEEVKVKKKKRSKRKKRASGKQR
ncbi:MAG: hypothetical protein ACI4V5_00035 [Prevotella sp.]